MSRDAVFPKLWRQVIGTFKKERGYSVRRVIELPYVYEVVRKEVLRFWESFFLQDGVVFPLVEGNAGLFLRVLFKEWSDRRRSFYPFSHTHAHLGEWIEEDMDMRPRSLSSKLSGRHLLKPQDVYGILHVISHRWIVPPRTYRGGWYEDDGGVAQPMEGVTKEKLKRLYELLYPREVARIVEGEKIFHSGACFGVRLPGLVVNMDLDEIALLAAQLNDRRSSKVRLKIFHPGLYLKNTLDERPWVEAEMKVANIEVVPGHYPTNKLLIFDAWGLVSEAELLIEENQEYLKYSGALRHSYMTMIDRFDGRGAYDFSKGCGVLQILKESH